MTTKTFSQLFTEIEDDLSMVWKVLEMTPKQKEHWSAEYNKFSIEIDYKDRTMDITYYSRDPPSDEAVFGCIVSDSLAVNGNTFSGFCGDFGYDTDSIKAHNTFKQCKKQKKKLLTLLGEELFKEFMGCEYDL